MVFRINIAYFVLILFCLSSAGYASIVTLGQAGLMSLDYYHSSDTLTTRVIEKRLSGDGVEFDIHFQGNTGLDSQMFYGSSVFGGSGNLVFADLSDYSQFQIDVKLLGIETSTNSQEDFLELWFSPMVYDSDSYKFFNAEFLSTSPAQDEATASMDIGLLAVGESARGDWIFEIGYEIHKDNPDGWPTGGTTVTLLLSPTYGAAQIIPEPLSITYFVLGALGLVLRKK